MRKYKLENSSRSLKIINSRSISISKILRTKSSVMNGRFLPIKYNLSLLLLVSVVDTSTLNKANQRLSFVVINILKYTVQYRDCTIFMYSL